MKFMVIRSDPIVLRGIPLDQQTRVVFYGTPLQVLSQQGRIGVESVLGYYRNSFWLHTTKRCDGSCRDCCKVSSSTLFCCDYLDEESDVNEKSVHPQLPDSSR